MNDWITAIESALEEFKTETNIPYWFERFDGDEKRLPDTYIVYFLVSDSPLSSADGKERVHIPRIQVSLFYRNKATFLTVPDKITDKLTEKGFRRSTTGRIPYQQNTGHYGWRSDFTFYEKKG